VFEERGRSYVALWVSGKTGSREVIGGGKVIGYLKSLHRRSVSLRGMRFEELLAARRDEPVFALANGRPSTCVRPSKCCWSILDCWWMAEPVKSAPCTVCVTPMQPSSLCAMELICTHWRGKWAQVWACWKSTTATSLPGCASMCL
jgi:hypothetical protein